MKNNFQTILIAVFMALFVFGVLIFSGLIKISSKSSTSSVSGKVVVWGTFDSEDISKVFENITGANKDSDVTYIKKDKDTYEQDLIEAFASGNGPDVFFLNPSMINRFSEFTSKIPYSNYPEKSFRNTFIDGAGIYLSNDGIIALPVVVDPMVLYYNKDALSNDGIAKPPLYWDELLNLSALLTKKDKNGNISQSMIPFGQFVNVNNAKDILATLLIQSGNNIVSKSGNSYVSVLNNNDNFSSSGITEKVFEFFVEFSNPISPAYSWNRALPNSFDMFTSGKLVFYPGFASELFKIQSVNPNLGFDVTDMPQSKGFNNKRTYGDIYALAVSSKSTNQTSAFVVAGLLSDGDNAKEFGSAVSLPTASKALLGNKPTDNSYMYTFFNEALISRSWIDPNNKNSDKIFSELIENILSGKFGVNESITRASGQLDSIIKK